MPTDTARIAFKIMDVFEGQAEGYFAVSVLAVVALTMLVCATFFLVHRKSG
jgi:hypothetical protein